MVSSKKKEIIMAIENDGRIREFATMKDAGAHYRVSSDMVAQSIESKERVKGIWFRRTEKSSGMKRSGF